MTSLNRVLELLRPARRTGTGWQARCPAHEDLTPSLSIGTGEDGRVLLKCFAGCPAESIVAKLGMSMRDLMPDTSTRSTVTPSAPRRPQTIFATPERATEAALRIVTRDRPAGEHWRLTQSCRYDSVDGAERMRVLRFEPDGGGDKTFRPITPCEGGWRIGDPRGRLPLYRLPNLAGAHRVFVVEGEKCVQAAERIGLVATTSAHGAESPARSDWEPLAGREVVILPDNDDAGRHYAEAVEAILRSLEPGVVVHRLDLPGLDVGGDIVDFIAQRERAGGEPASIKEEIEGLLASTVPIAEQSDATDDADVRSSMSFMSSPLRDGAFDGWPQPLRETAFHGVAGDFVRLVAPESEADPAALLVQFLVGVGSIVGRRAAYLVEGDRHFGNLFVVLTGATSSGRKGTSLGRVRQVLVLVDEHWARECQVSGLSTGEGLIHAVRDPQSKLEPRRERGKVVGHDTVIADEGVADKRLLVVEAEFASTLRVMGREGNTLSPVMRNAWDGRDLRSMTKNSPARATDPHISVIAHITKDEALRYLERTEAANGFGNRFLWACVKRSQELPFGGQVDEVALAALAARVRELVARVQNIDTIGFDEAGAALWCRIYGRLSAARSGMFGALTARAEAQVVRLATLYAILDSVDLIGEAHLRAALELWRYCADSVRYVFGDAVGDPIADAILRELRAKPGGLDRTGIRDLFGRNRSSDEIERALSLLEGRGLAQRFPIPPKQNPGGKPGGRTAELWVATTETILTTEPPGAPANGDLRATTAQAATTEPLFRPTSDAVRSSSSSISSADDPVAAAVPAEPEVDAIAERAAIHEYDAGMPRPAAEARAAKDLFAAMPTPGTVHDA